MSSDASGSGGHGRALAACAAAAAVALLAHSVLKGRLSFLRRDSAEPDKGSRERLSRWVDMWQAGRTNFHQPEVHPDLLRHKERFLGEASDLRVLVPLCGKTVDLPWLASQASVKEVVGNEAVEKAVQEFMKENGGLNMGLVKKQTAGAYDINVYSSDAGVTLLQGDFFGLTSADVGEVQRVWDRAALIAIQPEDRHLYIGVLKSVLAPQGKILLETLDRASGTAEAMAKGPPFSAPDVEVHRLFASWCSVEKLGSKELIDDPDHKRFKDAGLTSLLEQTFLLQRK